MKTCFVVCPIGAEGSEERKRSDSWLHAYIIKVCKALDYQVVRADHVMDNDKIDQTILNHLEKSELVIADVTDFNPNVFYEVGYRTALKKPIIHMAIDGAPLPFDIFSNRTIYYTLTDVTKIDDIMNRLKQTIETIEQQVTTLDTLPSNSTDNNEFNVSVLNLLFNIKDSVDNLYPLIKERDSYIIKELIAATSTEIRKTSSDPMQESMKEFMSMAMKSPQQANDFIKLMMQFQK